MSPNVPIHVLVVEDNPGDRLIIEDYLNEVYADASITFAASYKEFLEVYKNRSEFDTVFMDLSLPDIDKSTLLSNALKKVKDIPLIVLTGYSDMNFALKALSLGASDYLLKDEMTPSILYKSIMYSLERKQYILEIKHSEMRYSKLFQLSPQPMWVIDSGTFKCLNVNKSAVQLYGYSADEFLGMRFSDLHVNNDFNLISNPKSGRVNNDNVFKHRKKNGEEIYVNIALTRFELRGNLVYNVLVTDITERLSYLSTIEEQNKKLWKIAYSHSHFLRAPLARILGLADIIINENISGSELIEYVKILKDQASELDGEVRKSISDAKRIMPEFFYESSKKKDL